MSSDDIANLFRQFGGAADSYKELGRDNVVRQSRERWPLLANVRAEDAARRIESVRAGEGHRHDGPAPLVFDESAAERAAIDARTRVTPPAGRVEPELRPETFVEVASEAPEPRPAPIHARAPTFPSKAAAARAATPAAVPAPAGTELQGLFSRIARQPEPTAAVADPEVSLLRRLLKP